uniref:Zinc finger protein 710 n=1 Tax=Salvator merianae TaxID=96440 RepID=A0A8D0E9B8_SALMN
MERFASSGTQTDAVVVLSLAQAAVLGLVSENEFFGATVSAGGFFSGFARKPDGMAAAEMKEPESKPPLENDSQGQAEPPEEEDGEAAATEGAFGKHSRRRKRPPVRLVPKVKPEKGEGGQEEEEEEEEEGEFELSAPGGGKERQAESHALDLEEPSCEQTVQSRATKMIDLSVFGRKPRRLRPLRRPGQEEMALSVYEEGQSHPPPASLTSTPENTEVPSSASGFPACAPSLSSVEDPNGPQSPAEQDKSEAGFVWQDFEAEAHGEPSKKVQLDRLDINVQIDDSYLVEKRWQCRLCEKSYTSKYNLVTHILGHNGIKPHCCPHCNKLFKQPSHLQTHLLTHQGTRPHKCQVCHKAFTQTSHLKRHMLLHSDIKPYSCRFCGRGFAYPSELKAHEGKHESGRCHVCVECGLDFSTLTQLKRHLATHQGPTLYPCPECSKSFHYRSQLQNHLLKHQNVRPFVCTECGMEFSQIHHLKQHSLTHKVCQPFKCKVRSAHDWMLKRSVLPVGVAVTVLPSKSLGIGQVVHINIKPSAPEVCGKSFNRMYNLLGHMHLHAGSKPFKCPYCSSKFNLKGNLSRHMKVKHGVMDISLESQDAMLELTSGAELDGQQEMEDYEEEENPYNCGVVGNPPSQSALTEQAMKEMAYYSML